jgi:hypothetical protein
VKWWLGVGGLRLMGMRETSHRAEPHRFSHRLTSHASLSRQHAEQWVNVILPPCPTYSSGARCDLIVFAHVLALLFDLFGLLLIDPRQFVASLAQGVEVSRRASHEWLGCHDVRHAV